MLQRKEQNSKSSSHILHLIAHAFQVARTYAVASARDRKALRRRKYLRLRPLAARHHISRSPSLAHVSTTTATMVETNAIAIACVTLCPRQTNIPQHSALPNAADAKSYDANALRARAP